MPLERFIVGKLPQESDIWIVFLSLSLSLSLPPLPFSLITEISTHYRDKMLSLMDSEIAF